MAHTKNVLQRIAAAALLAGLAVGANVAGAQAQGYDNGPPPPPPRHEIHAFRHGYVWEGGHWRRAAGRWIWSPGRLVAVSPGRHWVGGHWLMTPRGRVWVAGHWS